MAQFSEKALRLILDAEGLDQPGKWPGASSGVTIGIGYDLGYVTVDQFEFDWGPYLSVSARERLKAAIGLIGTRARKAAEKLTAIRIRRKDAEEVFRERSLPLHQFRAAQAFPGLETLPLDAQGALVSLVFNRGTSMIDKPGQDRRREMRAIRDAVPRQDLREIAAQLRSMKRLWEGKGLQGLIDRREAEARLVESCIG